MSPSNSPDCAMIQPKLFAVLFSCSLQGRAGGSSVSGTPICFRCDSIIAGRQCWSPVHFSPPFSQPRTHGPKGHPASAKKRPRSRCRPHRTHRGTARLCASSSLRRSPSTASSCSSRPMEAWRPNRTTGTTGRRISGSPRPRRRPQGSGTRLSRSTTQRPSGPRSRVKSP
jgi:hypothetical protein